MKLINTPIEGCLIIQPDSYQDKRGYFFEAFNLKAFTNLTGLQPSFVQDNVSKSAYGVLRGLHFQKPPYSQTKLVSVLEGEVLDVVVDLRENSKTYGHSFSIILSAENKLQLYVPKGFAHGFIVLSDEATFCYKCDDYYHKEAEGGIRYDDPQLKIDWMVAANKIIVSDKDSQLPFMKETNGFSI